MVDLLTRGPKSLVIISVVGMYGLGKTTLSKMVYNDPEVNNEYKIRAFVYVTRGYGPYDKKEVLVNILNSLTLDDDNAIRRMDAEDLRKHVHQQLEGKKYLIVLDNDCEWEGWHVLKDAFPKNGDERCRVLITTRDMSIAKFGRPIIELEFLHAEVSRELLRWRVFGKNDCPVEVLEYEEDIVKKCDGVPLTIVVAASMILKHGWKYVAKSMENYIARDPDINSYVKAVFYVRLPNPLKSCFVYLAAFPRDFEIPVWKLLRLWIAEGLIHNAGSYDDLEDIAEVYMDELVAQNLVMVSKRRSNGKIGMCRMNDFCKKEAARQFLVPQKAINPEVPFSYDNYLEYRYRYIFREIKERMFTLVAQSTKAEGARSVLLFSKENVSAKMDEIWHIPGSYWYLKVLEAESLSVANFPFTPRKLALLKYLAISGKLESLPADLLDLWNLQTLIVNTTYDDLEIKADMWKIPNFRHLHTNAAASFPCLTTKCQEIQDVENNVRTLCWISTGSCKKKVFDQTSKLEKLGIRGMLTKLFEVNGGEASFFSYLHKFKCLVNLKLWNDDNLVNKLPGLPPKGAFPKQLTKLTLWHTRLDWKEMRTIGENMEVLKLEENAFVGEQWKSENCGFLRLIHLHIGHTDLMVWEASADHFPILRSLEINGCDRLRRVPYSLADILSLQSVRLHNSTSPGVGYSLKRIRLVKFLQAKQADKRKIFEISVFPPQPQV